MITYPINLIKEIFNVNNCEWTEFMTLDLECQDLKVKTFSNSSLIFLFETLPLKNKLNIYSLDLVSKHLKHLYLTTSKNLLFVTLSGNSMFRIYKPNNTNYHSNEIQSKSSENDFIVKSNSLKQSFMFNYSKTNVMSITKKSKKKNFNLIGNSLNPDQVFSRPHTYQYVTPLDSLILAMSNTSSQLLAMPNKVQMDSFAPDEYTFHREMFGDEWDIFALIKKGHCPKILAFDFINLKRKIWNFPSFVNGFRAGKMIKINFNKSNIILNSQI